MYSLYLVMYMFTLLFKLKAFFDYICFLIHRSMTYHNITLVFHSEHIIGADRYLIGSRNISGFPK